MSEEVEITIKELRLNGNIAIRIMKCLKEHDPEVWEAIKQEIEPKLKESLNK